ncbi:MAG: hypothetical protein V4671_30570 [Armatimonadota bacterium]
MKAAPTLFWHTAPLHYIPHLLLSECLYSQDELKVQKLPIRPRSTAERRDRKLRLSRFVHLSFASKTPLLAHKLAKSYPHALLAFDAALVDSTNVALVKYNAKVCVTVNGDVTISAETDNAPAVSPATRQKERQEVAEHVA